MNKKRKLLIALLSVACATCCAFGISACSDGGSNSNTDSEIYAVWQAYAEDGGTLSYDEWLASIKGDDGEDGADGVGISDITTSKEDGVTTITITLTNGETKTFTVSDGADGDDGDKGDKGDKGDQGDQGEQGEQGETGTRGSTWTVTSGAPNGTGLSGDMWLDADYMYLYTYNAKTNEWLFVGYLGSKADIALTGDDSIELTEEQANYDSGTGLGMYYTYTAKTAGYYVFAVDGDDFYVDVDGNFLASDEDFASAACIYLDKNATVDVWCSTWSYEAAEYDISAYAVTVIDEEYNTIVNGDHNYTAYLLADGTAVLYCDGNSGDHKEHVTKLAYSQTAGESSLNNDGAVESYATISALDTLYLAGGLSAYSYTNNTGETVAFYLVAFDENENTFVCNVEYMSITDEITGNDYWDFIVNVGSSISADELIVLEQGESINFGYNSQISVGFIMLCSTTVPVKGTSYFYTLDAVLYDEDDADNTVNTVTATDENLVWYFGVSDVFNASSRYTFSWDADNGNIASVYLYSYVDESPWEYKLQLISNGDEITFVVPSSGVEMAYVVVTASAAGEFSLEIKDTSPVVYKTLTLGETYTASDTFVASYTVALTTTYILTYTPDEDMTVTVTIGGGYGAVSSELANIDPTYGSPTSKTGGSTGLSLSNTEELKAGTTYYFYYTYTITVTSESNS